jgi:hypothetical protein
LSIECGTLMEKNQLLIVLQSLLDRARRPGMCLDCGAPLQDYRAFHECAATARAGQIVRATFPWWFDGHSPKARAKGYAAR